MKIKPLTKEQVIISADRLTRFKDPETKYLRVFKDIILSNLIEPKFKRCELDEMDYGILTDYAQQIFNSSLNRMSSDLRVNKLLAEYENSVFYINDNVNKLLQNNINYEAIIDLLDGDLPLNLLWLKTLCSECSQFEARNNLSLRFPIEKVVISEGITEEILLPEFAKIAGYDFDKNGVYVISAGGKNQVVKLFYQLSELLKLPIFVLLDNDAQANYEEIKPRLRSIDMVHVLAGGEFEDVLPVNLVKKVLKDELENISVYDSVQFDKSMVKTLEELFRNRGLHEFKKAEFAHLVKEHVSNIEDLSPEIVKIIDEIRSLNKI